MFSKELRKRRIEGGYTLRSLEERTGISDSMLSRYENGMRLLEMSIEHAWKLSEFFGWQMNDMANQLMKEGGSLAKKR